MLIKHRTLYWSARAEKTFRFLVCLIVFVFLHNFKYTHNAPCEQSPLESLIRWSCNGLVSVCASNWRLCVCDIAPVYSIITNITIITIVAYNRLILNVIILFTIKLKSKHNWNVVLVQPRILCVCALVCMHVYVIVCVCVCELFCEPACLCWEGSSGYKLTSIISLPCTRKRKMNKESFKGSVIWINQFPQ